MDMRRINLGLLALLLVAPNAGCQKSESAAAGSSGSQGAETVARIHWLGKQRLARETNAAYFMGIWNLPESSRLEGQTLDKLAVAPWRFWKGEAAVTNAPRALLRPLLEDLVREESYFEVSHARSQPGEFALAIRLTNESAGLWQTNLATALESLTGLRVSPPSAGRVGWLLKKHDPPNLIELARVGEWTLLAAGQNTNALLRDVMARIDRDGAPFGSRTTNYWLEANLDLRRVSEALTLNWELPKAWPQISLAVIGDGENVRSRGELTFSEPLSLELEPWNIPTNLVRDPLVSFSAIRGIRPWLASLDFWKEFTSGLVPNQFFTWAQQGAPMQTYLAVPVAESSNHLRSATPVILKRGNDWLATNGVGRLEQLSGRSGVVWGGGPFVAPRLESVSAPEGDFIFAGLWDRLPSSNAIPPELLEGVVGHPDLVYYDWEITQTRLDAWIYLGQVFRLVSQKAQMPKASASMAWFTAAGSKMGNSVTVVTGSGSQRLSFVRKSSAGLTALELHLLTDWLESPQFPRGLHTTLTPPSFQLRRPVAPSMPPTKR
ncbi:MAG: hypothetical protein KIS67_03165 [Verrucomicrobiae bacterium]|nr:hypothetical protein [Verrucomicrobiae bacterium]